MYCLINLIANFSLLSFITCSYFNLFFASQCQAKLPRGIQNIRPHLESVDNVPLLVPLFTDCTPSGKGRHFLTVVKKSLLPPCWRKHLNCGPNFGFCFVVVVLAINCFSAFVEIWYVYLLTAVKEMIAIMQDYGEVVCCVGSSFNSANPAIFIQADIGWVLCLKNSHSWLN